MGSLLHKAIAGAEAGAPAPSYSADVVVKVRCLNGNATWGFSPSSNGSYTVDWGDGTVETDTYEHYYANAGDYVVQIDGAYSVTFSYDASTYSNGTYVKELLNIGSGITYVASMFQNCHGLDTIADELRFPHADYDYVFSNCTSLTSYPDGLFQIDDGNGNCVSSCKGAFEYCSSLTDIGDILDGCGFNETTDFSYLFYGCTNLTYSRRDARAFPPRAGYIFYGCASLTESPLGKSGVIMDIQYAFAYSGIQSAHFNQSLTYYFPVNMSNAFEGCTDLYDVRFSFNEMNIQIMQNAFKDCTSLSTVNFPSGISISGNGNDFCDSAFSGCTNLSSFQSSGGYSYINTFVSLGWDSYAQCFHDCTSLPEYNDLPDDWK